jgi:putative mRNA 3-end processing factor
MPENVLIVNARIIAYKDELFGKDKVMKFIEHSTDSIKSLRKFLNGEFRGNSYNLTQKSDDCVISSHPRYGKYIRIDGIIIAIDHWNPKADLIYISHAHMDHIPNFSKRILEKLKSGELKKSFLCSHVTKRIAEMRTRNKFTFPESCWLLGKNLSAKNKIDYNGIKLELIENGHTYGSTSLLIKGSEKILYTSDFTAEDKVFNNDSTPLKRLEPIDCEILIMECTYGSPQYVFPSFTEIKRDLNDYIKINLENKIPTIILAYAFGKSQILLNLLDESYTVIIERTISKHLRVLEELGIKFKDWVPYGNFNKNQLKKKSDYVLINPPFSMFKEPYKSLVSAGARVVYATGKGLNTTSKEKFPVDKYLLYSDHCSFNQLYKFIIKCSPRKVYLEHGKINEFSYFLKSELNLQNVKILV